LIRVDRGAYS